MKMVFGILGKLPIEILWKLWNIPYKNILWKVWNVSNKNVNW